jgi:hypothetical protein
MVIVAAGHTERARDAARAWTVFHHKGLTGLLAQFLRQDPRNRVIGATRRLRHEQSDRTNGKLFFCCMDLRHSQSSGQDAELAQRGP